MELVVASTTSEQVEDISQVRGALTSDRDGPAPARLEYLQAWTTFQTFQQQEAASGAENLSMKGITSS
jgi:hypothetical protein